MGKDSNSWAPPPSTPIALNTSSPVSTPTIQFKEFIAGGENKTSLVYLDLKPAYDIYDWQILKR